MSGRSWTKEEDAKLLSILRTNGRDWAYVQAELGRTEHSARIHIDRTPSLKQAAKMAIEEHYCRTAEAAKADAKLESLTALDPTNAEILKLERENVNLAAENTTLKRKLSVVHKDTSLFQQLAGVMREVVQPLPEMRRFPVSESRQKRESADDSSRTPCDFVLILADEHADEVVSREATFGLEHYNYDIFRVRLENLRNKVRDYATVHLPRHRPERLWVFKLGDAVNGDIHGHGPRNHFANTLKAALAVGDAEAQFVQSLVPFFPEGVHVVGVSGNHPRRNINIKKDYDSPLDNFDFLVGTQIATRLATDIAEGRVSVTLPESWSAYVRVRDALWCLNHGDDTTGYTGLPWVGFDRRNGRVQSLLAHTGERVTAFAYGHYHTPATFPSAGAESFHSGCWVSADPYAINRIQAGGEPQQSLIVVGDKPGPRSILLRIPIYVRHEDRERAFQEGTYTPDIGQATVLSSVIPKAQEGLNVVSVP